MPKATTHTDDTKNIPMVQGERYRLGYAASVAGILGRDTRPVSSKGSMFYNRDRWTLRILITQMCKWAKENPGRVPTKRTVATWVKSANGERVFDPEIVLATTPDQLPLRMALAMTGGAYHEALHTLWSCRRDIQTNDVAMGILARWAKVKDWSPLAGALLEWSNIIEDIRIERRGREEFPGTEVKFHDLQDFILSQEREGLQHVKSHGDGTGGGNKNKPAKAMSIITGTFRDAGLGYNTESQRAAMEEYREADAKAHKMVLDGPLRPMLEKSVKLKQTDEFGSMWLALDVVAKLAELGQDQSGEESKNGQAGDGVQKCPKCGADADKLVVRPLKDDRGHNIPGKGIVTCTACGHQEEVDIKPQQSGGGGSGKGKGIKAEGFGKPDKKEGQSQGQGKGQGKGQGQDGDETPGGDGQGQGQDGDETPPGQQGPESKGAGGHHYMDDPHHVTEFGNKAKEALAEAASGKETHLMDNNAALGDAAKGIQDREDRDIKSGEAIWRPYQPGLDIIEIVKPSRNGKNYDLAQTQRLLDETRQQSSFLLSLLRTVVRAMEIQGTVHGVPRGIDFSEQFLVDSFASLKGGDMPGRPYYDKDIIPDTSMAAVLTLDESGSMCGELEEATKIMCSVCYPLDALGCPTMACGVRNGPGGYGFRNHDKPAGSVNPDDKGNYHRYNGVFHDIFKLWHEKFTAVKWRMSRTVATGSTPLADGIQFALEAIAQRREGHRFVFVVTDGHPDGGHAPVIKRQCRLAKKFNIHIIGVGCGSGATFVKNLFPDHVYADRIEDIPRELIKKLNQLVHHRIAGQSQAVRLSSLR